MTRKNGCFNRLAFVEFHPLSNGKMIKNFSFGQPCKYRLSDLGKADQGCIGCVRRDEK